MASERINKLSGSRLIHLINAVMRMLVDEHCKYEYSLMDTGGSWERHIFSFGDTRITMEIGVGEDNTEQYTGTTTCGSSE